MNSIPQKCCTKCNQWYPETTEYFHRQKHGHNGLLSWCKSCVKDYHQNPEARIKRSRRENTLDGKLRRHELRNTEAYKDSERIRKQSNEYRVKEAEYRKSKRGKENIRRKNHKRRTMKGATKHDFNQQDWDRALDYFGHKCAVCHRPESNELYIVMDHWKPLSKGGDTTVANIIPLCHSKRGSSAMGCNNRKWHRLPHDWLIMEFDSKVVEEIEANIEHFFVYALKARNVS